MRAIQSSGMELQVIAAGMHLSPQFGNTIREIEKDGFRIVSRIDMTFASDSLGAMAKSIGVGVYGLAQAIEDASPDCVLILGDRVEAFAGAVSAAALNCVVGHLHGGEITRGGLDESMRHAITKLSHLHFAASENSRRRIIRMGEDPRRVFNVGSPALDVLRQTRFLSRHELERKLGIVLRRPLVVVVQHPVTSRSDSAADEMRETLEAVKASNVTAVVLHPNSDSGGRRMIDIIRAYSSESWLTVVPSLPHEEYLSLIRLADVLVGNSSSGIIEGPFLHVAAVNVGERQDGRDRGINVLDTPHEREAIRRTIHQALSDAKFRRGLKRCRSPYGEGQTSRRIIDVLRCTQVSPDLIQKQLAYEK
jgi:UDP-N-acetylglucosamine 2-epimerase (non-hydrolysing)/GDP/UDP-N,N'-diacetylbacillosamine 2-epimerase (hydrolysing)